MKRTLVAAAAALMAGTGAAGVAMAQPGHYEHHDRYGHGHYVRHHDWRRGHRLARSDWSRGERLDWRRHHLRQPPRGYEWREIDGNYVLAAMATGVIASIIANSH